MDERRPFVLMFPCYILVSQFNTDPETGEILFDDFIRFIAPEVGPTPDQITKHIGLFTDFDSMDRFRQGMADPSIVRPGSFATPASLLRFLRAASPHYQWAVVDLVRGKFPSHSKLIADLIESLERGDMDLDDPNPPL